MHGSSCTPARSGSSATPASSRTSVSNPGDVFRIETGGGGGALPATDRDPDRVRADIEDGILTPAKARDTYGLEQE